MGFLEDLGKAALAPVGLGLVGLPGLMGIAGGMADKQSQESLQRSGIDLVGNTDAGKAADEDILKQYQGLQGLVGKGPGESDVTAGLDSTRGLANMLEQYRNTGGLPDQSDMQTARGYTNDIFAAQQTALNQGFEDQNIQANRLAAQLGRPVNDPILRAKLAQDQIRQQQLLESQKTGFTAQYAQNLPMQRLGFAGQLADVRNSLASQAMSNRQALLGMGQSIQTNERNFRLAQSNRWATGSQTGESGGGVKGAIGGFMGGLGMLASFAGMGAGGGGGGMGGMFGGGQSKTMAQPSMSGGTGFLGVDTSMGMGMAPTQPSFLMSPPSNFSRSLAPRQQAPAMFNYSNGALNMGGLSGRGATGDY